MRRFTLSLMALSLMMLLLAVPVWAQEAASPTQQEPKPTTYTVATGTRIPLLLINSISTRNAQEGDRVYLETGFPIVVDQKIVIPPGSYVLGTVTQVKRPGRVKGRGELYVRFDTLTLPNGVTRDFRGRVGSVEAGIGETLEKKEGKIESESSKGADAGTIASTTATGASIGAIAGSATGRPGLGTGIGAAAGAAAGLVAVLLTRGREVLLLRGTQLDMVLDRELVFTEKEVSFEGPQFRSSVPAASAPANRQERSRGLPLPFPRF